MMTSCISPDTSWLSQVNQLNATTQTNKAGDANAANGNTVAPPRGGDFRNAVKWQKGALDLAQGERKKEGRYDEMRARLELYLLQKPYHCGCETSAGVQLGGKSK